jgi:cold shock CspA family protein
MSSLETTSNTDVYVGRVKWFNNKAGYGFITITDGPKSGTDVFSHHSAISVEKEQYRYLVQGEYVNLTLSEVTDGTHAFQGGNITGINGGQLMCETLNATHRQVRNVRPRTTDERSGSGSGSDSTHKRSNETRSENPRHAKHETRKDDDGEWEVKSYKKILTAPQSKQPPKSSTSSRNSAPPSKGKTSGRGKTQR